jgi:hypothetical protein
VVLGADGYALPVASAGKVVVADAVWSAVVPLLPV